MFQNRVLAHVLVETLELLRELCLALLVVASVTGAVLWSPTPIGGAVSWYGRPGNAWASSARDLMSEIPDDAVVAANYRLTPHLAHRTEIYQFPVPFRAVLYGPDDSLEGTRLDERADRVDFVMLPVDRNAGVRADWAAVDDAFDEVGRNRFWVLYERNRSIPLPS